MFKKLMLIRKFNKTKNKIISDLYQYKENIRIDEDSVNSSALGFALILAFIAIVPSIFYDSIVIDIAAFLFFIASLIFLVKCTSIFKEEDIKEKMEFSLNNLYDLMQANTTLSFVCY